MERKTVLEGKELTKKWADKWVLKSLSFKVFQGEIVGLLGHNGAGKTTAFDIAMGFIQPDRGSIFFHHQDITNVAVHKRALLGMSYLSQEPSILRSLTVEQNLLCMLETSPLSKKEQKRAVEKHLEELQLTPFAKKKAYLLSGGQKRRVEIAGVLIRRPEVLLLDEPFANIDPKTISDLKEILRLLKKKNISILITDHNAREIFNIVDRSYLISGGELLAEGSTKKLLEDDRVRNSYLGNDFTL